MHEKSTNTILQNVRKIPLLLLSSFDPSLFPVLSHSNKGQALWKNLTICWLKPDFLTYNHCWRLPGHSNHPSGIKTISTELKVRSKFRVCALNFNKNCVLER